MYETHCKICGQLFEHRFPSVTICDSCKVGCCEACGKSFTRIHPYDQKYCSKECRIIGLSDPKRNAELTEKRRQSLLEKSGVDNVAKLDSVRAKLSDSKIDPLAYAEKKAAERLEQKAAASPNIRRCKICNKEFIGTGSQCTCKGPHYKQCVICGNLFEYKHESDKRKTCSSACWHTLRKQNVESVVRICEFCGKEFHSASNTAKYCNEDHFSNCVICGAKFKVDLHSSTRIEDLPKTCSLQCRQKLIEQTNLERYGEKYAAETAEAREQSRQRAFATLDQRIQTNIDRYGYPFAVQSPEIREKLSNATSSDAVQSKIHATNLERYERCELQSYLINR